MTIDEAINNMFSCATAERCLREDACLRVVKWARDQRAKEISQEVSEKSQPVELNEVEDCPPNLSPNIVWEWARATE